jgi:hypothetical protein
MNVTLLNKSLSRATMLQARPFSVAYNVKSKFEDAYKQKMEALSKVKAKV